MKINMKKRKQIFELGGGHFSKINKRGFTLIELLAVIIILAILMIIAVPSVSHYISSSRKSAYVATSKEYISGVRNIVNSGDIKAYEKDVTYYIPGSCVSMEIGGDSPYGKFLDYYVVVTYDGDGYDYYWVSRDDANMGIYLTDEASIDEDKIVPGVTEISTDIGIGDRQKIKLLDNTCKVENALEKVANESIGGEIKESKYTVSFDKNGGFGTADNITVTYGSTYGTLPVVTRTGYEFLGWYTELNGGIEITSDTEVSITENQTLYAKWLSIDYSITYNLDGGSLITQNPSSYNAETDEFTLKNPSKVGYVFVGWTGSNGSTPSTSVSIKKGSNGDKTYVANWEVCNVKEHYTYTGNSSFINDGSGNYRIKFLTSGTLSLSCPVSIDVFLVGGGSAGGGSGYTKTVKTITLNANTSYPVVVGSGGTTSSSNGKASSAFGNSANGGSGKNGGSGAGKSGYTEGGSNGASNGGSVSGGGTGQGSTTREFGEATGTLYAGGGGGGTGWCYGHCPTTGCNMANNTCYNGGFSGGTGGAGGGGKGQSSSESCSNGKANTGSGAGLGIRGEYSCSGGSGIVIIRNHR